MALIAERRRTRTPADALVRSLLTTLFFLAPALVVRCAGLHPMPLVSLVVYGAAVVAASFLLAWAAEAASSTCPVAWPSRSWPSSRC